MKRSSKKNARANAKRQRSGQRRSGDPQGPEPILPELTAGRDHGTAMLYDPNAVWNYQSEHVRYLKAVDISSNVMRPEGGGYRVASAGRSTLGYWNPGAVRVYCQCSGTADPYGTIVEFDIEAGLHSLVVRTSNPVTLMRWVSEPNCEFTAPDLVPVATLSPEDDVVTFTLNISGAPHYSFQVGTGYSLAFACAKVVNLEPQTTVLQLL